MAGTTVPSLPSYTLNAVAIAARNAQYAGTPLTDGDGDGSYNSYQGCNRGASCAPGIGINTGDYSPKDSDWSLEDQHEAARTPQDSQHIGGSGLGAGTEGLVTETPVQAVVDPHGTPDFNDPMAFVQTAAPIAPGGALVAGVINRTGLTVPAGANCWGTTTTA